MNRFLKNTTFKNAAGWTASGILLALSIFVLLYYITGPSLGYIHSDCTDSLLWSLATAETGDVLAEDFHYAALLPFGAPVWTVPIIAIFGYSVTTYKLSMSVFAVIFVLSAFSMFRAMKWKPIQSAVSAFCVCMLLSGSAKLREIMWEHTIYYSLALLFIMLLLNLCFRLMPCIEKWKLKKTDRKNYIRLVIYAVLLFLLCIGCGTDGMQVLVISAIPVIGAWLAYTVFDDRRLRSRDAVNRYILCGIMMIGIVIGLLLLRCFTQGGKITAGYEDAYSTWSSLDRWEDNAKGILEHYLSLFGISYGLEGPLFSFESVLTILKVFCALVLQICPILLLCRYKTIQHRSSKIVLWTHLATSFVILFGVICGSLSSAEWRLIPMLGTGILCTIVYLRELCISSEVAKRIGVILAALLMCVSLLHAYAICSMPYDEGNDRDHAVIAQMLEEKGYDYGYATFWNCHITRLLSNNAVFTLPIEIIEGDVRIYQHQLRDAWIQPRENQDCFLLLSKGEYDSLQYSDYWIDITGRLPLIDSFEYNDYCVFVFEGNVIQ